ncbi:MAG: polyprenyl synthetase family protein [Urechidicola sp.]|nr:polyprenyl synthetase family protein [Urechidicola sp.]
MQNNLIRILNDLIEENINFKHEEINILTTLYGISCGNDKDKIHIEIAKVLELMKSSALILDDFLDKADIRNGVPSIFSSYGSENAVLVAEIIKSTATIKLNQLLQNFDSDIAWKTMCIYEETYRTICFGQLEEEELLKSQLTKTFPTKEKCISTIVHTTATFIQLPLIIGSLLSKKNSNIVRAFANFGLNIGIAYQIRDDLLDILASTKLTGKPENGDLIYKKKKIPIIYLRDRLDGKDLKSLLTIYNSKEQLNDDNIAWIKYLMNEHNVVFECQERVNNYCEKALNSLTELSLDDQYFSQFKSVANLLTNFDNIK